MTTSLTQRRSRDAAFDLEAYLRRIGGVDCRAPDLGTLRAIVARHARAIAFENLDPFLRRPVRLDTASLTSKLVHGGAASRSGSGRRRARAAALLHRAG